MLSMPTLSRNPKGHTELATIVATHIVDLDSHPTATPSLSSKPLVGQKTCTIDSTSIGVLPLEDHRIHYSVAELFMYIVYQLEFNIDENIRISGELSIRDWK
jgi:hypothetical protein